MGSGENVDSLIFPKEIISTDSAGAKLEKAKAKDVKKRNVVKCFLFTNHLIVTTRFYFY
jgi:hypothetical protein